MYASKDIQYKRGENMENKRLIVLFAGIFSIAFSIFYYFLFQVTLSKSTSSEKRTLYMNQVGLYEKQEGVNATIETLKTAGFQGYALKQGKTTAVVCSVSVDETSVKKDQEKLKELNYRYIEKSVMVEDEEIVNMIDKQQFEKALERIGK